MLPTWKVIITNPITNRSYTYYSFLTNIKTAVDHVIEGVEETLPVGQLPADASQWGVTVQNFRGLGG